MEIDTIGEILNISMGAAATAVSTLLNKKVYITTPKVEVTTSGNFEFKALTPGVGVEINYIEGLSGVNVFVLKQEDVQKIVSILLQTEYDPNEEFTMDEISVSAICETMNQMMGSSSTALAQFLNRTVNISTPTPFEVDTDENFSKKYFNEFDDMIAVKFNINVEGVLDSEFASFMSFDFAKELLSSLFSSENNQSPTVESVPAPEPVQQEIQQPVQQPVQQPTQKPSNQSYAPQENYNISSASFQGFEKGQVDKLEERPENLKLIMSVPLKITVELGHSKKSIKDILEFANGSIIELNKQAGMPVDILVNGQKIAKGDVVVVEEYYGVRITEILNPNEIIKVL
ncbi:MAG: flagellar motor switch phosphatase FliY [Clostridia bacterium]|nr:flagellar motor switch phosphatase FliY [Clostridia bacterium]